MGQLLLHIGYYLAEARPIWVVCGPLVAPSLERCSANVRKLCDGMPEPAIGGIGIDTLQHQLGVKVIKGGGVGSVVWIGSRDCPGGCYGDRYAAGSRHG